jgi:hypothetical protein
MTLFRTVVASSAPHRRSKNAVLRTATAGVLLAYLAAAASPAAAVVTDPMQLLYFISGVRDDGGGTNTGVATVIHCSNWSGATERFQYVVFTHLGTVVANLTQDIPHGGTKTASTHGTALYFEDLLLGPVLISQGLVAILATHRDVVCTVQVVDASVPIPNGITLHSVRYNPIAGTQE